VTEADWNSCTDPQKMLEFLRGKVSDRKLRLFACACCRQVWHLLDRQGRTIVKVAEDFAEGKAPQQKLSKANAAAQAAAGHARWDVPSDASSPSAWAAASGAARSTAQKAGQAAAQKAVRTAVYDEDTRDDPGNNPWDNAWNAAEKEVHKAQAALLRDIVPFQPVSISPVILAWNDQTIPKLVQTIYEERELPSGHLDPERLAVLADALEEAGCDNADILGHLRGPGPHTRGCWPLDLLLGKS
jgi:hypothetical protein